MSVIPNVMASCTACSTSLAATPRAADAGKLTSPLPTAVIVNSLSCRLRTS
jgi:hypothetical protein